MSKTDNKTGPEKSAPRCLIDRGGRGVESYLGNAHMETTHIIKLPLSVYIANVDIESMINVSH